MTPGQNGSFKTASHVAGFQVKPFDPKQLLGAISGILHPGGT
jgi:hypothetical protein